MDSVSSRQAQPSSEHNRNLPKSLYSLAGEADLGAAGLWGTGIKTLGTGSWFETTCKKQEFHAEYCNMASCGPSSPIRGDPKVTQSGHLVFAKLILSSSHKVKREATDPPRECPVIINDLELEICIKI
jgi:hypothetical protein